LRILALPTVVIVVSAIVLVPINIYGWLNYNIDILFGVVCWAGFVLSCVIAFAKWVIIETPLRRTDDFPFALALLKGCIVGELLIFIMYITHSQRTLTLVSGGCAALSCFGFYVETILKR